jgi:type IV fimbrial biogenesis protein FimT
MRHLTVRERTQRGLTLVELMVAVSIAAFLAMSAAPYFVDYTSNSRLREGGHLLYSEALLAQSEAIKRNTTVRLATSGSTVQIVDRSVTTAPVVLRERRLSTGLSATTANLDFGSEGRPTPFGTSGSVDITMSSISCSADARCPGLRIDAGGAIRLCADKTATGC